MSSICRSIWCYVIFGNIIWVSSRCQGGYFQVQYASYFSVIFISVSIISLVIGMLVLHKDGNAPASQIFLAMMAAVDVWSFGLAFATTANNTAAGEIWLRFSAIGRGLVYSIILHFVLVITGHDTLLRKWWFRSILYLPAIICIFAFTIPAGINPAHYQLKNTEFGMISVRTLSVPLVRK